MLRAASTALLLGAAACCAISLAQTVSPARPNAANAAGSGKISSLGTAKPSGKLLSREELRSCLKQQAELAARKPPIEAQREALQAERQSLLQADVSLKAERDEVDRLAEAATRLDKRFQELSAQVDDFNQRVAKLQDSGRSGSTAERQRNEFERERQALETSAQALEAERAALKLKAGQAVASYNARAAVRDQAAADWNARSTQQTRSAQAYETERENWSAECAGRSFREDDEQAILSGK